MQRIILASKIPNSEKFLAELNQEKVLLMSKSNLENFKYLQNLLCVASNSIQYFLPFRVDKLSEIINFNENYKESIKQIIQDFYKSNKIYFPSCEICNPLTPSLSLMPTGKKCIECLSNHCDISKILFEKKSYSFNIKCFHCLKENKYEYSINENEISKKEE